MKIILAAAVALMLAGGSAEAGTQNLVQNPGFQITGSYIPPGYLNQPYAWAASGPGVYPPGSTIFESSFWDNGSVPGQGISGYVAFVQGSGTLSQMLTGLQPGQSYLFSMYVNERNYQYLTSCIGPYPECVPISPITQAIEVLATIGGNTVVGPDFVSPVSGIAPFDFVEGTFVATASTEELVIEGFNPTPNPYDISALFADPSVTLMSSVPEPSTLPLITVGLLGLGMVLRRRQGAS